MIDYPKIYAFCEVAECLSFTEAADRLYTTQSSLSKSIATLERTLGCQLFFRSNRNVTLTPAGEYLYEYYKNSLEEMHRAANWARELSDGKRGHLTIGIWGLCGIVSQISDVFLSFTQAHPMYSFEFVPVTTKQSREILISKKIDAVVTRQQDVELLSECEYKVLASCKLVAVARSNHPLFSEFLSPTLADLNKFGFVVTTPSFSPQTYRMILETCKASGLEPRIMVSESSLIGMLMHIASSDYVGIAGEFDCRNFESLRQIPIDSAPAVNTVLAWNRNNLSDSLQKFISYISWLYQK